MGEPKWTQRHSWFLQTREGGRRLGDEKGISGSASPCSDLTSPSPAAAAGAGSFLYAGISLAAGICQCEGSPGLWLVVHVEPQLRVSCGSIHPSHARLSMEDPGGCSADRVDVGSMIAQLCPPEHCLHAGKGIGGPPTFSVLTTTLGLASQLVLDRKARD